jgi:hypothetical protein
MTRLRIDADAIAALGESLTDHARALEEISALPGLGEGFIGYATDAIHDAVTDWERARVDICARLDHLAGLARSAGGVYVDTELAARARFRSPS